MIPKELIRRTEVKQPDGSWEHVLFSQIEPGDVFRQFEPDGSTVIHAGRTEFVAKSHVVIEIIDDEEAPK